MHIQTPVIFVTTDSPTAASFDADAPPVDLDGALKDCGISFQNVQHVSLRPPSMPDHKRVEWNADTIEALKRLRAQGELYIVAVGREAQQELDRREIGYTPLLSPQLPIVKDPERLAVHVGAAMGRMLTQDQMVRWTR
jgi:hypothetical protein